MHQAVRWIVSIGACRFAQPVFCSDGERPHVTNEKLLSCGCSRGADVLLKVLDRGGSSAGRVTGDFLSSGRECVTERTGRRTGVSSNPRYRSYESLTRDRRDEFRCVLTGAPTLFITGQDVLEFLCELIVRKFRNRYRQDSRCFQQPAHLVQCPTYPRAGLSVDF